MRTQLYEDIANFSNWLLKMRNVTFPVDNDGFIQLPKKICPIDTILMNLFL